MWAMLLAGGRSLLYLFMVVLLVTPVLQICHTCQVGAIRVFPGNAVTNVEFSYSNMDKKRKEDLFNKYFGGRTLGPSNATQKGFKESKRRVPSCPDPLHN
ncbi:hypothetical protein VNO77_12107 [Canavalia gladiata]|uniref:CLAVATA3/ESR (CLE)-related protein 27 n=1 Tax=Canavalia gladiata TaxID=3824 RepID=A0AAN9QPJ5_CANGL